MTAGSRLPLPRLLPAAFFLFCGLAGCSGGGSGSSNGIETAVQDLTVDPDGRTTVITFRSTGGLAAADASDFEADGGQTAQSVDVAGAVATVTWDARVSPSHRVRAAGLGGVSSAYHAVVTSDPSAPTFTVVSATQNPGLGGDTIELAFAGPRVVETEAEDLSRWTVVTGGATLDLAGSTLDLDPDAQTLDVVLGTNANLHADFTIAATNLHSVADVLVAATPVDGVATGDSTPPGLVSAVQNLSEDEYGRVVDFTFDEAMDPVSSLLLSHFAATLPDVATTVEQPDEDVLRVTFNNPMVPGQDAVLLQGLLDLHGNPFPDTLQAIAQPNPVANGFDGDVVAVTVANAGGDYVEATTIQAFDPASAVDPAAWSLVVAGNPVDLAQQTIVYDLIGKRVTIQLGLDLVNGDSFTLQGLSVLDVDGETFALSQTRTVGGETTAPTVALALQNRTIEPAGTVVDVQFSEDVDQASAESLASWSGSGGQTLLAATRLPGLETVRLEFDAAMVPGDVTISAQDVRDLAGNPMVAQVGIVLDSTDTAPPAATEWSANAREGADNDVVELFFDDSMVPADVLDLARWSLESPTGTPRALAGATIEYEEALSRARLKLVNGQNLRRDDDFTVVLTNVRDLGGNALPATPLSGPVTSESTLPTVHTIWRPTATPDQVEVRFSEPCDLLEDLYDATTNPDGTRYVLRDSGGALRGLATSAISVDGGLGARASFGIVVDPADRIDVLGAADLAGNPLFPALLVPTVDEDPAQPGLALGASTLTAVSGEENDVLVVEFDRPVSPWTVADHVHYTVTGPTEVEKRTLDVVFDGVDTVTLPLRSNLGEYDLLAGAAYDLEIEGLRSAQGVLLASPFVEAGIVVGGDAIVPTVQPDKVRVDPTSSDALQVEFREAVAPPSATDLSSYDYDGGNAPIAAEMLGARTVRLTFAVTPVPGATLALDVDDRAGNPSGLVARTVGAADATGPLVVSVAGVIRPGFGGDEVHVRYDEPVKASTALSAANYTISTGGNPRSLTGAALSYSSSQNLVRIRLAGGQELLAGQAISVGIAGIRDCSDNPMSAGLQVGGSVTGDADAPAFANAFVNRRADAGGTVVDVLWTEDVDSAFASDVQNWTADAPAAVLSVTMRERNHARLVLSSPLPPAGTLGLAGVPDLAGNVAGAITVDPAE